MEGLRRIFSMLTIILVVIEVGEAQLSENFYSKTCPQVESIVKQAVVKKYSQTFITAQATLRMFFHDCFVQVIHLLILVDYGFRICFRQGFSITSILIRFLRLYLLIVFCIHILKSILLLSVDIAKLIDTKSRKI